MKKTDASRLSEEKKCIRKLLRISWTRLMTNNQAYEPESELLIHVKSRQLRYFGHVMRLPYDSIERSVMVGLADGIRGRARPRIGWLDNITTWTCLSGTSLLQTTPDRRLD